MKVAKQTLSGAALARLITLCLCFGLLASLAVAQTQIYDFYANADNGTYVSWNSAGGSMTCGGAYTAAKGAVAKVASGTPEDGVSSSYLLTDLHDTTPLPRWIEGTYTNVNLTSVTDPLVRFEALVGFTSAGSGTDGLTFSVQILHGSEYFELSKAKVIYDMRLNTLSADLTAYRGQTITIRLRVETGTTATADYGVWKNAQVISYGTTLYDFVANAASASSWGGNGGSVTFDIPNTPPFPLPYAAGFKGYANLTRTGNDTAEDGGTYTGAIEAIPAWPSYPTLGYNYMDIAWNNFSIPNTTECVKFQARVGFLNTAPYTTDGVSFELWTYDGTNYTPRGTVTARYDGRLDYLTADLTPFKGTTFNKLFLRVLANNPNSPSNDYAIWTEAKLVGYDPAEAINFYTEAPKDDTTPHNVNWTSGYAAPPNNTLLFPAAGSNGLLTQYATANMENGSVASSVLYTRPNWNANPPDNYAQGVFDNVIIPNNWTNVRFKTQVGFTSGTASVDGVDFQVLVARRGKVDTVCAVTKPYNGTVVSLEGNLNGYQGENVSIILYVDAHADANYDRACWINPRIVGELPMQVYGADSGIIVNDASDDLTSLTRAVTLAQACSPSELLLSAGSHNLSTKLTVNNAVNLNLKGSAISPTTLLNADAKAATLDFAYANKNIAVRNLVIDYSSLPFTQGVISKSGGKWKLTIDTDDGGPGTPTPYRNLNDALFDPAQNPGTAYFGTVHNASAPYRVPNGVYDSVQLTWSNPNGRTWEVTFTPSTGIATSGMKFQWNARSPTGTACSFTSSPVDGYVIWDNITIYADPTLSFAGNGINKAFVRNCTIKIKPSTNRIKSVNGDGVHYQACAQGPDVIDSTFEGMSDDGTNFYTVGYKIEGSWNGSSHTQLYVYTEGRPIYVGNHLTVFRPSTGALNDSATSVTVTAIDGVDATHPFGADYLYNSVYCKKITVSADPKSDLQWGTNADRFFCDEWQSNNYLVTGCAFRNFRHYGVVSEASDGVITNNTFEYISGCAIALNNAVAWNCGLLNRNILIDNNTITTCVNDYNSVAGNTYAPIRVIMQKTDYMPGASVGHDNIKITNNHITNWPRHAIYVSNARNVAISGNTLLNNSGGYYSTAGRRGIMMFDNCLPVGGGSGATVTVTGNSITDNRSSSLIDALLYVKTTPMVTTNLSESSNTYSVPNDLTVQNGAHITGVSTY